MLAKQDRIRLLEKAVSPYRHIHVLKGGYEGKEMTATDEEEIRSGQFSLAAHGTGKLLYENGYYLGCITDAMCNPHRAAHSRGCAMVAARLAKAHGLDEKKAYAAGMLHDVTKAFSDEENRRIIELYKPQWLTISPKVWHSYTAVVWIRQNMHIYDHELLDALEHHTLGDGKTDLARILYIADKIEPTRGYDCTMQMDLALKDLKAAASLILEQSRVYIFEKEGIHV